MATLLALVSPVHGQDAAPVLSELDALRIQAIELALENLALRLEAARRDAEQLLRSLQRDGYTLSKERGPDGVARWVYRPVPSEKDERRQQ